MCGICDNARLWGPGFDPSESELEGWVAGLGEATEQHVREMVLDFRKVLGFALKKK